MNPFLTNIVGKKKQSRLGSLALVWQPVLEMESSEFISAFPHLKIDLVSHSVCGRVVAEIDAFLKKIVVCVFSDISCSDPYQVSGFSTLNRSIPVTQTGLMGSQFVPCSQVLRVAVT